VPARRPAPTPVEIEKAFGDVLRDLRKEAGLSQEQVGGRTFVSEMERGVKGATIVTLFRLAETLGRSPSEIVALVEAELRRR
jgi:transcriptional regulator with XRE-family HTH domain